MLIEINLFLELYNYPSVVEFEKKTKNFVTLYLNWDKKTNYINFRVIELMNTNKK